MDGQKLRLANEGILATVGNTPLVRLTHIFQEAEFRLFAKLEAFNPGGSTKDRPALYIIRQAIESGIISPGTVVIESSSGNMGIGLAQACSYYGLRFICVVDVKTTAQNIKLLRAYGAEVECIDQPDPATGEYLQARLNRVRSLSTELPDSFWPDQYSNTQNSNAHHQTMKEIFTVLDGKVDFVFCATSTCGTLRGCSEFLRQNDLKAKVIAVDAVGSVIFGGQAAKRLIPGHGAAVRPSLFHPDLADRCILVTDLDCVIGCRRLARRESILAGGSSGGVIRAVEKLMMEIPTGATCVAILPDRGERYLDTIYSDEWVMEHFCDISDLRFDSVQSQEGGTIF